MSETALAILAAQEWARAHASVITDPVEFGNKFALVYCSAKRTQYTGIPAPLDPLVESFRRSSQQVAEIQRNAGGQKPDQQDPAATELSMRDKPNKAGAA